MKQLLLVLLLIAACTQGSSEVIIGGAFGLTGAAADWGEGEVRAVELAIEQHHASGGVPVKLVIEDTKAESNPTLSAITKLIQVDGAQVVIGPTWGDSFGSIVAPVAEENQIVLVTPSGAIEVVEPEPAYDFFYSTWYPQAPEYALHTKLIEPGESIAIIVDEDAYNVFAGESYQKVMEEHGVTVLETFKVPYGSVDFRTIVTRMKELGPDAVFISTFEVGEYGLLLKTLREQGLDIPVLSTASAETTALVENYAEVAESLTYTFPNTELQAAFQEAYQAKYGEPPVGASAANAYDAARAVLSAINTGARTGPEVKERLDALSLQGTVSETLAFDERGAISSADFVIKSVRDGEFVVLE